MNTTTLGNVTREELVSNVRYGYWFNHLCERLYTRVDFVVNLVQLVGGSAAAYSVIQDWPGMVVGAGVALAGVSAVGLLVQPAVKGERHRRSKCQYLDLEAVAWDLDVAELTRRLKDVQKDAPTGLDVLTVPAYNATLAAIGATTPPITERWVHRVARALA